MATKIAILGAGTFVKNQYLPRLSEISHLVTIKAIWSRTQESARAAVETAQKHNFIDVDCKWGDEGLHDIIQDQSIVAVAVVLAGQNQVEISLRMLKAGKHVLQGTSELETALYNYRSISADAPGQLIWSVAENYRFEPAIVESKKLIAEIGEMMSVQVIIEGSMNSSNPYFSSSWRRNFTGGFVLDMGVHFIAGLRMLVGCDVVSVSAFTSHVDLSLPPPDNISSVFHLENGCSGAFVMVVSSRTPKACGKSSFIPHIHTPHQTILWRVVGMNGTVQIERGFQGQHGYLVSVYGADGLCKSPFFPFSGVTEELKAFISDVSECTLKKGSQFVPEPRLSFVEGARDVAVLEAMLESGSRKGELVHVKKF
ncbi:hypothetical protein TanjilG_05936 [Lupinus angustifolius]|uniref:Gfo/Idh/MocA-like oxidoreductase N-terminal domain-containing protein n=1 Tax=Lupinus angustifolius TaxID=3871 RepID=A0A4P1RE38_LUPAN|nr:hypothetical protein TanjilG_05936 [Lupinus angustifolius]